MSSICRRCGGRAMNGTCTLCGSQDVETVADAPTVSHAAPMQPISAPTPTATPSGSTPAGGGPRWVPIALIVAGVLVAGMVGFNALTGSGDGDASTASSVMSQDEALNSETEPLGDPYTSAAESSDSSLANTPTPTPSAADMTEEQAIAQLEATASESEWVSRDGRWVAQLSSKYVGVTDPLQVNSEGTHVFMAPDILAEHEALTQRVTDGRVVLINSLTYGKATTINGEPLWVTMVLNDQFVDASSTESWCRDFYPTLSGDALSNVCLAAQLKPLE